MKTLPVKKSWLAALWLCGTMAAHAQSPNPAAKPLLSQFVMPRNPQEGRDPFFPNSLRPYASAAVIPVAINTNNVPVPTSFDIRLKGFSGPTDHRLAIINNHTFETNEEAEVLIGSSQKLRVRCLEIKNDSVIIQIGAERRELRLRPGV